MKKKVLVTKASLPPYEEYIKAIKPLWETHWITNMGEFHNELERQLKEYLCVPQLSLMVNGHMALELTIQSFDFPEGGEVITTPFTFISTTHAIVRNRLKPVFCDAKECDGTIDESKIESLITKKTVAILPVHVYGNVCNTEEIERIAKKHNLKVIYDAAHAFGVSHKGRGIGDYGDASIFSFHATKIFNTIEGGAVTFRDPEIYDKLYNLKNFGIRDEEEVASIGANAKMNEFSAIMGLCNLNHISDVMKSRKERLDYYVDKLSGVNGLKILCKNNSESNYAYLPILTGNRDELYNKLRAQNIFPRKYFYPLTSDYDCFGDEYKNAEIPVARHLGERVLTLPLYHDLGYDVIDRIVDLIKDLE